MHIFASQILDKQMKLNIINFPNEDIKNIIFDFGGVIMDINILKTVTAFSSLKIEGLNSDDIISGHKAFLLDLELGNITPDQFIEAIYRDYPAARQVADKQIWDAWNALLQDYDPARIALIEDLKKHYNIYMLSNTNFPHRLKFKEIFRKQFGENLEDLFIKCYYSDEMHLRKPNHDIYEAVIKDARITPENTLFIDDNELNITEARKTGLKAYHLSNGEKITKLFTKRTAII